MDLLVRSKLVFTDRHSVDLGLNVLGVCAFFWLVVWGPYIR